jgi:hypothetical protein
MVPEVVPEDSVQSDAQVPNMVPHVRLATAFTPAVPGVQLVQAEAAFPENLPAMQSVQVLAPTESENLPAAQAVHLGATLHAAVKPSAVLILSEPNHILREPVVDL